MCRGKCSGCPFSYNSEYCIIEEGYIDDIKQYSCGDTNFYQENYKEEDRGEIYEKIIKYDTILKQNKQ